MSPRPDAGARSGAPATSADTARTADDPSREIASLCHELASVLSLDTISVLAYEPDRRFVRYLINLFKGEALGGRALRTTGDAGADLVGAFPEGISFVPADAPAPAARELADLGMRSAWSAPFLVNGVHWGLLTVGRASQEPFLLPEIRHLQEVRGQLAQLVSARAVERAGLFESARRSAVSQLSRLPGPAESAPEVFRDALGALATAFSAGYVQLSLREGDAMRVVAASSTLFKAVGESYSYDDSQTDDVLATGELVLQYRTDMVEGPWPAAYRKAGIVRIGTCILTGDQGDQSDEASVIGSIVVGRSENLAFSEAELGFLDVIGTLTKQAIRSSERMREIELQGYRGRALTELALLLHGDAEPEAVFALLVDRLPAAARADSVSLMVQPEDSDELFVVGSTTGLLFPTGSTFPATRIPLPSLGKGERAVRQFPVGALPPELGGPLAAGGVLQGAAAPLRDGDQLLGLLCIGHNNTTLFSPPELDFLDVVGALISQSIGKARREFRAARHREQSERAERLAAVGELVGGVAHELNNPLAAIMGFAELAKPLATDPGLKEDIEIIWQEAERARDIVRDLLFFARPSSVGHTPLLLSAVVSHVERLRRASWKQAGIDVQVIAQGEERPVAGNEQQLAQVLLNLVINAEHALARRLEPSLGIETKFGAEHALISITDNGAGMDEAVRTKVFQPFFTTKQGMGTGLGLSISHSIIAAHQGEIDVASEPGVGTSFEIRLPLTKELGSTRPIAVEAMAQSGQGRILVIDDEPNVRRAAVRMLERSGHVCTEAEDADSGLEMALDGYLGEGDEGEDFDVILCDYRLGTATATSLIHELISRRPELRARIILCTGATTDSGVKDLLDETGVALLAKPYGLAELRAAVEAVAQQPCERATAS